MLSTQALVDRSTCKTWPYEAWENFLNRSNSATLKSITS